MKDLLRENMKSVYRRRVKSPRHMFLPKRSRKNLLKHRKISSDTGLEGRVC
jgi:hypothetical protein